MIYLLNSTCYRWDKLLECEVKILSKLLLSCLSYCNCIRKWELSEYEERLPKVNWVSPEALFYIVNSQLACSLIDHEVGDVMFNQVLLNTAEKKLISSKITYQCGIISVVTPNKGIPYRKNSYQNLHLFRTQVTKNAQLDSFKGVAVEILGSADHFHDHIRTQHDQKPQ